MVKYLLNFCFVAAFAMGVKAQDQVLSKDENGKFIHYEVVANAVGLDSLKLRAKLFFAERTKELKQDEKSSDTAIIAFGKRVVSKTESVITHPDGEVTYRFVVELKDRKYRFWLTDFEFLPYQRDRYGNFVPSTTVKTPLEKPQGKLNAGQWKIYEKQIGKFVKEFAEKFKGAMATTTVNTAEPKKKLITKEW